jgi:hypothetical protein
LELTSQFVNKKPDWSLMQDPIEKHFGDVGIQDKYEDNKSQSNA